MSLFGALRRKPRGRVAELKDVLREELLRYRRMEDAFFSRADCGRHMLAQLNPEGDRELARQAGIVNGIAERLRAIDPEFPKNWTPLQ